MLMRVYFVTIHLLWKRLSIIMPPDQLPSNVYIAMVGYQLTPTPGLSVNFKNLKGGTGSFFDHSVMLWAWPIWYDQLCDLHK